MVSKALWRSDGMVDTDVRNTTTASCLPFPVAADEHSSRQPRTRWAGWFTDGHSFHLLAFLDGALFFCSHQAWAASSFLLQWAELPFHSNPSLSWAHPLDAACSFILHAEDQLPAGPQGQGELGDPGQTLGITELLCGDVLLALAAVGEDGVCLR